MGSNWYGFTVVDEARVGYGQVEPTHLSAQRTSQIYAQLPADDFDKLENGQFVVYDYAQEKCVKPGDRKDMEPMMVWNEIKLYDEREQMYKDYAMIKSDFTPGSDTISHDYSSNAGVKDEFSGYGPFKGQMVPRVIKTNVGDIMITNTLVAASTNNREKTALTDVFDKSTTSGIKKNVKLLAPNADGFLAPLTGEVADAIMVWQIDTTKKFTMPDGQPAVKIQRIK